MKVFIQVLIHGQGIFTRKAYKEWRLQASTGDFHVHTTRPVLPLEGETVTRYSDLVEVANA